MESPVPLDLKPESPPSLRELCDPLRGLWLFAGVATGWMGMAMGRPWGIGVAAAIFCLAMIAAKSRGSRMAVVCGLLVQSATGWFWSTVPAPRDRVGRFEVVVVRQTGPGKGECRILTSDQVDLVGRRIRCEDGRMGDTLRGSGELRALRPAGNPGGFEARDWGASAGIEGFLVWKRDDAFGRRPGRAPLGETLRRRTESVVSGTLGDRLESSAAALWTATILARNNALPGNALDAFRQSGLFHMLSVSGFHMAVLGGGLVILLGLVRVPRRLAWLAASVVVLAYAWLLRFPPPVTRSAVAFMALAMAMALGRRPHAKNALFLAAAILIVVDPNVPFQMGAQLTFFATAALLWGTPAIMEWIPLAWRRGRIERWILAPAGASVAATLATAPILAWHVGSIAWIGIPAGLVSALAFSVGFLAALGTAATGWLPAWCSWGFAGAAEGCARLVFEVALRAGQWAPGHWVFGRPSPVAMAGSLAMLVMVAFTTRQKMAGRIWVGIALVGVATWACAFRPDPPRMRLVFLDVGQGNATLVTWPSGRHWLVDAGPGSRTEEGRDAGRDAILPAMRRLGIGKLDAFVVSHADFDHYGGFEAVSREVPAGNVFVSIDSGTPPSPGFDSLATRLRRKGWAFHKIGCGQKLTYRDGAICEVVAPGLGPPVPRNQSSVALRFGFDTARALLPGDADSISEGFQVASGEALKSQVLMVGHHGSKHSSSLEWLRLVRPREAILAYGRTNRYGHPHGEVLERLSAVGARVWRTPDGAVKATLSARGVELDRGGSSWWRGPWRRSDLSLRFPWI